MSSAEIDIAGKVGGAVADGVLEGVVASGGAAEVQTLTVGPLAENCFLIYRRDRSNDRKDPSNANDRKDRSNAGVDNASALVIDPGEEPDRIYKTVEYLNLTVEAILITHTHFDHIGGVAPLAKLTGAPVYCPKVEAGVLADIASYLPYPELGPFESYRADELVEGGERLTLAGFDIDVLFTPGHSPGHVSYHLAQHDALFSGDVLFQGSVGRTDLPGSDGEALMATLAMLTAKLPPQTAVYPGHMGNTTLAAELATNPFLQGMQKSGE